MMPRPSFGGDLFSPEVSDSPFKQSSDRNSERSSISEILRKKSPLVESPLASTQSNENLELKKESKNLDIKKNLFSSDNVQARRTASAFSEVQKKAVKTSDKKMIKSETDASNVLPVSKKRESSKKSKNFSETEKNLKHVSSKSITSKASRNSAIQSKFITVRGSNSKRSEPLFIPSINEPSEEKENDENSSDQNSVFETSGDNKTLIEKSTELDTQLTKKEITSASVDKLQVPSSSTNEACQIQNQILEKLINDTVSNKFHAVRMQLHSMHFSLLKAFGERMDEVEKVNENLYKVIGELLEENRQLRNMVLM